MTSPNPNLDKHPLMKALKILQSFGDVGQHIWQLGKWYVGELEGDGFPRNKEPISQESRMTYLIQAIEQMRGRLTSDIKWRELPVDFHTFVESPVYMNKAGVLWPEVLRHGSAINSGRYSECVLTGAIGTAKTTLALYSQCYQIYIMACMENAHDVFGLDSASEILVVFQSINKNAAKDIDYRRCRSMVADSPWFENNFPFRKDLESEMKFPRNIYIRPVAGHEQAAIGQNVIGGILDELNFMAVVENSKQSVDNGVYDQAMQNYNAIARRRESRFLRHGVLPGMLCLVSSRKYPGQFTDKKEEEAKTNERIYVYSKRIWDLQPHRFNGEMFKVFIGDATRKPRVLKEDERLREDDLLLVQEVPVEYAHQFEVNILDSLRDILGVATQALHPFILNTDKIAGAFGSCLSIADAEMCDFQHSKIALYPKRLVNKQHPRFVHIDLAVNNDSCGLAIGHIPRFVPINRGEITEIMPVIQFDLLLEIKPPRAGEIMFSEVRKVIYAVRNLGLDVRWVTSDNQLMSKDTLQILAQQGFICGYLSVDTDTTPYDMLKAALYDDRVMAPTHLKARTELSRLEFDTKNQMVDHPPSGSKDVADAMAGVVHGLTMRREIWVKHGVSMLNMPKSLTNPPKPVKNSISYVETLRKDRWGNHVGSH